MFGGVFTFFRSCPVHAAPRFFFQLSYALGLRYHSFNRRNAKALARLQNDRHSRPDRKPLCLTLPAQHGKHLQGVAVVGIFLYGTIILGNIPSFLDWLIRILLHRRFFGQIDRIVCFRDLKRTLLAVLIDSVEVIEPIGAAHFPRFHKPETPLSWHAACLLPRKYSHAA